MPKAIRFHTTGGPDVLRWEDVTVGEPGAGEARVRHTAVGVNYIDTYHRSGLYPIPLPSGLGSEGAGVVEAVGPGVTVVKPGDRVAYAGGPPGSYAEVRLLPADRLVKVPDGITDRQAAAIMLKGMTVQYLIRRTYRVRPGDTVLFHAAAGGVGLIACQWLKALGATVIGTVGSDAKAEVSRAHSYDQPIAYTREDFPRRVREMTGGQGVPVVYDSVGKSTFAGSLDCLRPFGLLVSFGNASGPVTPFELGVLAQKGSLYVTRPTLVTYTATCGDLEATASSCRSHGCSGGTTTSRAQVGCVAARAEELRVEPGHQLLDPRDFVHERRLGHPSNRLDGPGPGRHTIAWTRYPIFVKRSPSLAPVRRLELGADRPTPGQRPRENYQRRL